MSDSDSATAGDLDTRFWYPDSLLLLQRDATPSMLRCLSCRLLLLMLFPFLLLLELPPLELLLLAPTPGAVSAHPQGCSTVGPAAFGPAAC